MQCQFYTTTDSEIRQNPHAGEWIRKIANGDRDAESLMWVLWDFEHLYDDLIDRDKPVSIEQAGRALIDLVSTITFNPFWQAKAAFLFPLLVSAVNRWIDGDEWDASSDPEKQAAARYVRCGDLDLYLGIAYAVGGWDHMRAMRGARCYDK